MDNMRVYTNNDVTLDEILATLPVNDFFNALPIRWIGDCKAEPTGTTDNFHGSVLRWSATESGRSSG